MNRAQLEILAAARVHDLSFVIRDHFRWGVDRSVVHSLAEGSPFQTTRFGISAHAFTHADAPSHVAEDGATLEELDPRLWVGSAVILDLTSVGPEEPIDRRLLEERGSDVQRGDIVLLKTGWDARVPVEAPEYWRTAPYVTREAAEWLAERGVRCVGFDFPQDHAIRRGLEGDQATPGEFVTHDVLLRRGIALLEYLCGLDRITADRVFLVAPPIKVGGADGGPTRALAFE
jgi:arylformamidase